MKERWVRGWLWSEDDERFVQGALAFRGSRITHVGRQCRGAPVAQGIVIPPLVDFHTHLADTALRTAVHRRPRGLEELVAPPRGLKHRFLAQASRARIIASMRRGLAEMVVAGTGRFFDFREGGVDGCHLLHRACRGFPVAPVVLGRTVGSERPEEVIHAGNGLGASGWRDQPRAVLDAWSAAARELGAPFGIHISEQRRDPILGVLSLEPDLLIHLCRGTDTDFLAVVRAEVPVVICPRANAYFGIATPIARMVRAGVDLRLGTDNGMLASFSLWAELEFAYRLARLQGLPGGDATVALVRALARGWKGLKSVPPMRLQPGEPARFIVVGGATEHPAARLVSGMSPESIVFRGPAARAS